MLKQRVITACILALLLISAIVLLPPAGFHLCMGLVLCLAAWEWSRLAGVQALAWRLLYVLVFVPMLYFSADIGGPLRERILLASVLWWLLALGWVLCYPRYRTGWYRPAVLLPAGLPLLLPGWLSLLYLRELSDYISYILLFLCLVAAADIGAYFGGRRFGRHKLAPAVSPNKTWEGVVGGQLAACLVLWLFLIGATLQGLALNANQVIEATLGTILLAACSVVGDLYESMVKRAGNLKDSGSVLPGHGGILDRIDSMTAALPVFVLVMLNSGVAGT